MLHQSQLKGSKASPNSCKRGGCGCAPFHISSKRRGELAEFLKALCISFNNLLALNQALTHKSYSHECRRQSSNNERLEFLGDSVLGLIITRILFDFFPQKSEGDLASIKSHIVSETFLSDWARTFNLGNYILLGKGEKNTGGSNKAAILADAFEALVGAYYLDQGLDKTFNFLVPYVLKFLSQRELVNSQIQDSKTLLQERVQKVCKVCPSYRLCKEDGPDHEKTFWIEVVLFDYVLAIGKGNTKKEAERQAAQIVYNKILSRELNLEDILSKESIN